MSELIVYGDRCDPICSIPRANCQPILDMIAQVKNGAVICIRVNKSKAALPKRKKPALVFLVASACVLPC